MELSAPFPQRRRPPAFTFLFAGIVAVSGCVADDQVDQAATQFVQATASITHSYQALLANANAVEIDNYLVNQSFAAGPINDAGIKGSALLTADEIKVRGDAMKALSDYTSALGSLAAGKSASQIQADANKASGSLNSFSSDLTTSAAKSPKGVSSPDFAGPAAAAVSAIGAVLKVIEDHRSASEIRESVKANDVKITPLFKAMEDESKFFFDRQTQQLSLVKVTLLHNYDSARSATPVDRALLMILTDHLQQYERDSAALGTSDPTKAIEAFEKTHAALVKVATAQSGERKKLVPELIAETKSLIAEVNPPAKNACAN